MKTISFNIEEIVHAISNALCPNKNESLVYKETFSNTTGFASTKIKTMEVYKVVGKDITSLISYNYVVSPKFDEQNKQHEMFFIGALVGVCSKQI